MSKFIVLGVALALLAAGTVVAFKFTHRPALAASAQPLDPAILETHQRQLRDDLWLP
jgi:hypothetical protein